MLCSLFNVQTRVKIEYNMYKNVMILKMLVGENMYIPATSAQCYSSTNFLSQLRWYPESVRWYPTHVTWVDIRGGFKYTTCSYVGFLSHISGYTQRVHF